MQLLNMLISVQYELFIFSEKLVENRSNLVVGIFFFSKSKECHQRQY